MKAEFIRDENDWIWFFNAKEIFLRKCRNSDGISNFDAKAKAEKLARDKAEAKKVLMKELNEYNNPNKAKNQTI